ncbi:MAG: class I SAM-dependent methyltransferase [Dehalococcoidales bacterium]|nr:class I SAM-dependent methyltransferase [Dehalococcoidales bacterium]
MESYIQNLLISDRLRKPVIGDVIRDLRLPEGSHGLDAGCGIGLQCLLLAGETGIDGHITGLDVSGEMLEYGSGIVKKAGMSQRISFQKGDINSLPFDNNTFDWAWSTDCVGYAPLDPLPLLREMIRVVKPGGTVAIAAWSSEKLLPGYPQLEARLGATAAGIAPFVHGKDPEWHFMRAMGWFHRLGMKGPLGKTYAGSVCAPLDSQTREAMLALFDMRWPGVSAELTPADLQEFQRLCRPDSADFILKLPDYCAFFTYTAFRGKKAG